MAKKETVAQKKMHHVMSKFKRGTLHIGRSDKFVTKRPQAIAIGLSVSGLSKKK